ncbi:MAG: hypothetical protein M3247_02960 [Thermoproteota archaeon]|nr:hypothetical protein [Thermoproteota archaeon]
MLKSGAFSDREVAYHTKLPLFMVQGEKDSIARQNKVTQRFLNTGIVQLEGYPHVTLYQR